MVPSLTPTGETVFVIPIEKLDLKIPLYNGVVAGFPSPADDYLEEALDVGKYLVKNPDSTFFVRVRGDSMIGASIYDKDILVVDRSLRAVHGNIVIAVLNQEFTVKRLYKLGGKIKLLPANPNFTTIAIGEGDEFKIWGVVDHILHKPV